MQFLECIRLIHAHQCRLRHAGCMHCSLLSCQKLSPVARAAVPCNGSELSDTAGVGCRP